MQKKLLVIFLLIFILGSGSLIFLFQQISKKQMHETSTSVTTSTYQEITTTILQKYTNETFASFNLTGVFLKNGSFILANNVTRVEVSLNTTQAKPGDKVELKITFFGYFSWGDPSLNDLTMYYIKRTINIHYFGVEFANETSHLLVPSNGPWDKMITQVEEPQQLPSFSPTQYLTIRWVITPTQNVVGKTLKICGGYFAAYNIGNWAKYYNRLAYQQAFVINSSVINIPSINCEFLKVV
jgi:hypothetical protein